MADYEEEGKGSIRLNSEEEEAEREPSIFENDDEEDEDDGDEEDEGEEDETENDEEPLRRKPLSDASRLIGQRSKLENLAERMRKEKIRLRVHDILIKGNTKTKESIIEAEVEAIKNASTMQELLEAAAVANAKLQRLEIFDSVKITLDSGPPELPGTANVVIEVVETSNPLSGECGAYTKPAARSWTFEGSVKYKNWLGYGDLWDGSLAYGPNQTSEVSTGVYFPRLKRSVTPLVARLSLLSQDWLEFSSYKERSLGLSLGLYSTKYHDLAYSLGWRTIIDPSQMASNSIRRQLGNSLLSSLKYTLKVDKRNSAGRPTRGYAFVSTSQIGGLAPDHRSLRFVRQEFDLRYAIPLGFDRAAMNFGVSAGVVLPWGNGFMNKPSPLPERFFLGGDFSPVCTVGGPTTVWGFKTRRMGPTEPRREVRGENNQGENSDSPGRDFVGGDLAVTAFADLSFDFPIRWLREHGIHGHIFAGAGNLAKLTENEFRSFSFQKFLETFRTSVGAGIVLPTRLFRLEGNFYYILKQQEHDRGKTGFRFSISAPS
ncbi:sorting and assembly machinery component 50 homolog isoform X2 [Cucurbita pepo subsp. pepo]|uniref:sorting and assembly machinery component 50 homolog isoform X1 n=1 Tax=Cucurbita pepo subsp. pepo TaxID=3664 RepID=UPI000C9D9AAD|nr:sorting and assembly machinery component 50 homolog isoform X1 [Cucurbita pepo subsp. pepo]XP_023531148.1 sorting and assembly machinery component 50 homolog isoform X2 [Cucurbita pepo subsp. pepo]